MSFAECVAVGLGAALLGAPCFAAEAEYSVLRCAKDADGADTTVFRIGPGYFARWEAGDAVWAPNGCGGSASESSAGQGQTTCKTTPRKYEFTVLWAHGSWMSYDFDRQTGKMTWTNDKLVRRGGTVSYACEIVKDPMATVPPPRF